MRIAAHGVRLELPSVHVVRAVGAEGAERAESAESAEGAMSGVQVVIRIKSAEVGATNNVVADAQMPQVAIRAVWGGANPTPLS